jgi:hypothetical protein
MSEDRLKNSNRLSILHPKIYINALVMLVVGSFNSIGQKALLDKKYGDFRHPIFINLGMFYGEYLNYLLFMVLFLIPTTAKSINKEVYHQVSQIY